MKCQGFSRWVSRQRFLATMSSSPAVCRDSAMSSRNLSRNFFKSPRLSRSTFHTPLKRFISSRGDIVDGPSLLELLRKGQLAGAGLDVFHLEPPVDEWEKAVISLPNGVTVATCHIGAQTSQAQRRESVELARKIATEASKTVAQTPRP